MIFRRKNDFEQFSVTNWISGQIGRVWRRLLESLGQDEFSGPSEAERTGVMRWLSLPFRIVWAVLGFLLTTWSSTRPGKAFGRALPALLVAGSFVGVLVLAYTIPFRLGGVGFPDPAARYEARSLFLRQLGFSKTNPEEKKQMLEGSLVCARQLVKIRPRNESAKYLLGTAFAGVGDLVSARNVMQSIAPENGTGLSLAHIWLAHDLLTVESKEGVSERERQEKAYNHLRKIEESASNSETIEGYHARVRMASLLVRDKRHEEATGLLESVLKGPLMYPVQLEAIVLMANVYKAREKAVRPGSFVAAALLCPVQLEAIGQVANVCKAGEIAVRLDSFVAAALQKLTEFTLRHPDQAEIWETMVSLNVIMERFQEAALQLRDGIMVTRDVEVRNRLFQMQSILFVKQSELVPDIDSKTVPEDEKDDIYKQKFLILAKAIVVNPSVREIYVSLLPFLDVKRPNPNEAVWLREIFLNPEAPSGVLHAVVGLRDMLNGNFSEGQGQWLIASRKMPSTSIVINNLLQVLADEKPDDLQSTFNLVSVAIESFPDQSVFFHTRAKILKKLNRIDQAASDLVVVLDKFPDAIEPRQLMIEIQQELGNTAEIEKLQQEIRAIEEKSDSERLKPLVDRN